MGAQLAAANARRLRRAGRRLHRSGDFGPATALYATALEEAVKAGVLILLVEESGSAAGDHADILRLIFSHHKTKYRLAAWAIGTSEQPGSATLSAGGSGGELLAVLGILLAVILLVDQVRRGEKLPNKAPPFDFGTAPFLRDLSSGLNEGPQTWAGRAFAERNRGLYVAFVNERWQHPGEMSGQDADAARRAVVPIVRGAWRWARAGEVVDTW